MLSLTWCVLFVVSVVLFLNVVWCYVLLFVVRVVDVVCRVFTFCVSVDFSCFLLLVVASVVFVFCSCAFLFFDCVFFYVFVVFSVCVRCRSCRLVCFCLRLFGFRVSLCVLLLFSCVFLCFCFCACYCVYSFLHSWVRVCFLAMCLHL